MALLFIVFFVLGLLGLSLFRNPQPIYYVYEYEYEYEYETFCDCGDE